MFLNNDWINIQIHIELSAMISYFETCYSFWPEGVLSSIISLKLFCCIVGFDFFLFYFFEIDFRFCSRCYK